MNLCERLTGRVMPTGTTPFVDTADVAVGKAYLAGILRGTSTTTFTPDRGITRQKAAVLLMGMQRHLLGEPGMVKMLSQGEAKALALSIVPAGQLPPLMYQDKPLIAAWAGHDVARATALSLLNGVSATRFDPLGALTREQTFVILLRQYELFLP